MPGLLLAIFPLVDTVISCCKCLQVQVAEKSEKTGIDYSW